MTDPADLIEVLSRRHGLLRSLQEAPKPRHVLVDHVDDSKSTVYRGVSQLVELGLVKQTDRTLEPTLFGRVALARYDEMARTAAMEPLLAALPDGEIEPAALVGAEPVVPDSIDVERHHDRVAALLEEATALRGFSPAVSPASLTAIPRRVREGTLALEFVLSPEIVSYMEEDLPDALAAADAAEDVSLYVSDRDLAMTVMLVESPEGTTVCVELGEDGVSTGLLVNDTPEARRWAESAFARHREAAEPVTTDSSPAT